MRRLTISAIVIVAIIGVVAGVLAGWNYLRETKRLPVIAGVGGPFSLVDHRGNAVTERDYLNKPSLVFFGFTHCPDVCPTTLLDITNRLNELGPSAQRLNALFITVDPERDTPEQLATYLSSFHERITGLSGTPDNVAGALRAFRAFARKVPLAGGDYTMDHTASIYLLNKEGGFVGLLSYKETEAAARLKIRRLLESP
jgi:protein SCO1/2